MMKEFKKLGCIAALALTMASAQAVPACITNVYLNVWGTVSVPDAFTNGVTKLADGGCTNISTYSGLILMSDCTSTNCTGAPITLTPCHDLSCNDEDTIIGTLWWKCDSSTSGCDPSGGWHSLNIVLPKLSAWVTFYVCSSPTANCSLFINCITRSTPCLLIKD